MREIPSWEKILRYFGEKVELPRGWDCFSPRERTLDIEEIQYLPTNLCFYSTLTE